MQIYILKNQTELSEVTGSETKHIAATITNKRTSQPVTKEFLKSCRKYKQAIIKKLKHQPDK